MVAGFKLKVLRIRKWKKIQKIYVYFLHDNGFPDRPIYCYNESIIHGNWTKVADELPGIFTIMYNV